VRFYRRDDEMTEVVSEYLAGALRQGGTAIVFATRPHRLDIEAQLSALGVDLATPDTHRAFVALDARATIQDFLAGDRSDWGEFEDLVGRLVHSGAGANRPVHAFGEMVALLWDAGRVNAAIELEGLWNELCHRLQISLLCAYPWHSTADGGHQEAFDAVCDLHTSVIGPSAPTPLTSGLVGRHMKVEQSFAADSDAPRRARRFVIETLRRWGELRLVDDAAIVVTELATNAVVHAQSELVVAVQQSDESVVLSVRDASSIPPQPRHPSLTAFRGRGLEIVASIATKWGADAVGDGKVVWAELRR
jgi:hypothetical protein